MIGSLFTGYGGLDMATQAGFNQPLTFVTDIEPGPCKILAHRHPDVPNLGDVTAIDWTEWRGRITVLTGGFPCTDVSLAGRRAGLIRGETRSGLWSEMHRAIVDLRPRYVLIENVRGLLSAKSDSDLEPCPWCVGDDTDGALRALGAALGDLADAGYDARWCGLRAADLGACHGRYRVFILAQPSAAPGDANRGNRKGWHPAELARETGPAARPDLTLLPTPGALQSLSPNAAAVRPSLSVIRDFGPYSESVARHERLVGRPAPEPTEPGPRGRRRLSPRFVEWMMCLPDGWVTDVPGITHAEALRALGNGVVPPQAEAALRHMLDQKVPS